MTTIRVQFKKWPVISGLSMFFLSGTFAGAQSAPGSNPQNSNASMQDRDITRRELANFDEFLDSHREISEQVRKDPSLLDNQQYLKDHPDLQRYLWNHPGVREEVKENPTAFMHQENRYDRQEDAAAREATREKLQSFDQFLDKHREIAEQVRRNPSLLDNQQFLKDHPELQTYLQDHTGVRNALRQDPEGFMLQEKRFDRREDDRDLDSTRGQLASFDQFLDKHREVAEQVRKDPSLLNNQQFLKDHPALQTYLQDHKGVREEVQENPGAFMHQENRFDRTEAQQRGDQDTTRGQLASFDQFLDKHREVAEQVRKDPSLLENQQFLKEHPALQTYLQDHKGVREEIQENPSAFMHQENRFDRTEAQQRGDQDTTRGQLASFDQFLDKHREVAEQVRKDPSLLENQQFLKDHPDLQTYLQDHKGVREEIQENPSAFMRQENRFDRTEGQRGDPDAAHRQFGEFLGHHMDISRDLDKDASVVKKDEYVRNHPELQAYLNAHPEVRQGLMADPHGFVKSTQQFNTQTSPAKTTTAPTTAQPKP